MLSEIASENFEANLFFFSEDELIAQIRKFGEGNANTLETFDAPKIFDTILKDQGLFVERVSSSYSFSHLTFQEYLTANHIAGDTRSIQDLVERHLHDEQWREVFLLTAGLMREADDLLEAMEVEAAKSINTDRVKTLFQWAKRVTNASGNRHVEILKREFVLDRYFCLWLMNKIHKAIKDTFSQYRKSCPELSIDQYLKHHPEFAIDQVLSQERSLYLSLCYALFIYTDFESDFYLDFAPYLDVEDYFVDTDLDPLFYPHLYLYFHQEIDCDVSFGLYRDLYRYVDADFYNLLSSELDEVFNKGLDERITIVERMEKEEIYREVDLQRIVQQYRAQRRFIKAARERRPIKPLENSIHETWLSVLHITDDMLAISQEEMRSIVQYFRAVKLIVACKEAAGRVSPDVWQEIEDRLLAWDAEGSED